MPEFNKVTALSKTLAVLLFVLLICGAFWFGIWYHSQLPSVSTSGTQKVSKTPDETVSTNIEKAYRESSFKVVALAANAGTATSTPDVLYVVTKRGANDQECGGRYDSDFCYFFLERAYSNGPSMTYLGTWGPDGTSAGNEFHFIDAHTVEFKTYFADGGLEVHETWHLNTQSGSTTLVASEQSNG